MSSGTRKISVALWMTGLVMAGTLAACKKSTAPEIASTETFRFKIASGPCADGACPVLLRLDSAGRTADTAALGTTTSDAKWARVSQADSSAPAARDIWTAGTEENEVTTAVEPVKLDAKTFGVLVHQTTGFEHLKRRRDLFAIQKGQLKKIWSAEDGAGPAWSVAFAMRDDTAGTDRIVYASGMAIDATMPDLLSAQTIGFESATGKMIPLPAAPVPALIISKFPTVDAARAAASDGCHDGAFVVAPDFIGKAGGRFSLARIEPPSVSALRKPVEGCADMHAWQAGTLSVANRQE